MPADPGQGGCFGIFIPAGLGRTEIPSKLEQSKRVCRRSHSEDEILTKLCHLLGCTAIEGRNEAEFRAAKSQNPMFGTVGAELRAEGGSSMGGEVRIEGREIHCPTGSQGLGIYNSLQFVLFVSRST